MDGIVEREALRHAASSLGADTSLYSGQTGMQAGQGLPPTPWLRDDNRYTWADVANMSRGEFDRRRELHVSYGAETPHVDWFRPVARIQRHHIAKSQWPDQRGDDQSLQRPPSK